VCTQKLSGNLVRQDEADRGERSEQLSTVERDELKQLLAENAGLGYKVGVDGLRSPKPPASARQLRDERVSEGGL
jgi:hypothetical protein